MSLSNGITRRYPNWVPSCSELLGPTVAPRRMGRFTQNARMLWGGGGPAVQPYLCGRGRPGTDQSSRNEGSRKCQFTSTMVVAPGVVASGVEPVRVPHWKSRTST